MNNTHTKAMKTFVFTGSPVVAWALPQAAILGLAPAYCAPVDALPTIRNDEQGTDPPTSPS